MLFDDGCSFGLVSVVSGGVWSARGLLALFDDNCSFYTCYILIM